MKEMFGTILVIFFTCWISFSAGRLYEKREITARLWKECMALKKSPAPAKRIDNIWLAWQGGVDRDNCRLLYTEDFCTIHNFWEEDHER